MSSEKVFFQMSKGFVYIFFLNYRFKFKRVHEKILSSGPPRDEDIFSP